MRDFKNGSGAKTLASSTVIDWLTVNVRKTLTAKKLWSRQFTSSTSVAVHSVLTSIPYMCITEVVYFVVSHTLRCQFSLYDTVPAELGIGDDFFMSNVDRLKQQIVTIRSFRDRFEQSLRVHPTPN